MNFGLHNRLRRWEAAPSKASLRRLLWALPVVACISVFYLFLASAGTFEDLPTQLDYYDQIAEGFRQGHLYIPLQPSPSLVALEDPFKFEHRPLWLWDATLYKGHYYLYWGPVPALFMLAYKVLTGTVERITDQWPTAIFMVGRLWAGAALILSLASRVRIRQPPWICCLAIAVFGLANPTPFIVARPHVYEAALAGGQCFLFWGLLFAFWGIERPERRRLWFVIAGVCWALAIGCRVTNFISVPPVLAVAAGFAWYNSSRSLRGFVLDSLALGVPVALGGLAYGGYNYARFGSFTEFGVSYQLTFQPFFGSPKYVLPNVFSYLFGPVRWSCSFPFVHIVGFRPLASLLTWPPGYQSFERVGGIMLTAGWCWFSLLLLWHLGEYLWTRRGRLRVSAVASDFGWHEVWLALSSVSIMLSVVPVLSLWEASMRYVEDALGGIVFLATLAVFWLLRRTYSKRRSVLGLTLRALIVAVGIQTCVVGALAGFKSYDDSFQNNNPKLFRQLDRKLSFCSDAG
jgi:hypothetical protein